MRAIFVLNENETEEDVIPKTPTELAILKRGFLIITEPQLAALYLVAKYRLAKREDKSDTFAGRMAQRMNTEVDDTDFRALPFMRLADVLGMNPMTVARTTNKFMLLMQGMESASEHLYKKVINAFYDFEDMQEGEVYAIAEPVIDYDASTEISDLWGAKMSDKGKADRDKKRREDVKRISSIKSFFEALKDRVGPERAVKNTIDKFSVEFNKSPNAIKELGQEAYKGTPFLLKYWR